MTMFVSRFRQAALLTGLSALTLASCSTTGEEMAVAPATPAQAAPAAPAPAPAPRPAIGSFGFDLAGMDRSVSPGQDFYAFANGTWARNTAIPADRSNYGMFAVLDDLSRERTRAILEQARGDNASVIGRAYASFMDEARVEQLGMAPIQPWLTRVRALSSRADYVTLLAEADRAGIGGMFGGYVGQDDRAPENYIFIMGQGGIGMPDREFYLGTTERFQRVRAAYLTHLEAMLTLAGEGNAAARAR